MELLAIKIEYWTLPDGTITGMEPEGIDEFRSELQENYVSLVRGHSGACGGGLYDLIINVTSTITLRDLASAILGGIAYDLVKSGTHSLVLRPLISAIKRLKERNQNINQKIEVDEFRFTFQDADIIVKNIGTNNFFENLEKIFIQLSKSIDSLKEVDTQEYPHAIHIPLFEDPEQKTCRFRSPLDVDEMVVNITNDDYLKLWGVRYNLEGKVRVYDVKNELLIDSSYMTQDEYWRASIIEWQKGKSK